MQVVVKVEVRHALRLCEARPREDRRNAVGDEHIGRGRPNAYARKGELRVDEVDEVLLRDGAATLGPGAGANNGYVDLFNVLDLKLHQNR
jgi:hypothetical protein